jgi:hypothetical protein
MKHFARYLPPLDYRGHLPFRSLRQRPSPETPELARWEDVAVRSDLALRSEGVITESADIRRVEPLTTYLSGVLVQLNPLHRSAFICSLVLKV